MASMLVFTTATSIDTQSKSSLPSYVNELQFSISGENVSVGHGLEILVLMYLVTLLWMEIYL